MIDLMMWDWEEAFQVDGFLNSECHTYEVADAIKAYDPLYRVFISSTTHNDFIHRLKIGHVEVGFADLNPGGSEAIREVMHSGLVKYLDKRFRHDKPGGSWAVLRHIDVGHLKMLLKYMEDMEHKSYEEEAVINRRYHIYRHVKALQKVQIIEPEL